MGDMADWYTDGWQEEAGLFSCDTDDVYITRKPKTVACKYCSQKMLHWKNKHCCWRLYDKKGNLHSCKNYVNQDL